MKIFQDEYKNYSYYKLKNEKIMADQSSITVYEIFRKISTIQKGLFLVETVGDTNTKKYFWVSKEEVVFLEKKKEFMTAKMLEQQHKEINGIWI